MRKTLILLGLIVFTGCIVKEQPSPPPPQLNVRVERQSPPVIVRERPSPPVIVKERPVVVIPVPPPHHPPHKGGVGVDVHIGK